MNDILALPWYNRFPDDISIWSTEKFSFNQESIDEFLKKYRLFDDGKIHFEFSVLVKDKRTDDMYNTSLHHLTGDVGSFSLTSSGLILTLNGQDTQLYSLIDRGIIPHLTNDSNMNVELFAHRKYNYTVTFANFSHDRKGTLVPRGICIVPEDLPKLPDHVYHCSPRGHI